MKRTSEILSEQVTRGGVNFELFSGSASFVETAVDILSDESELCELLDSLFRHTDYLYAHSVGTAVYSVMLAEMVNWKLPVNKFKVVMGALFHDVGLREVEKEILMKPRSSWTYEETIKYETHPLRSMDILNNLKNIPSDVIHIVKEHHEDDLAQGFPSRMRKGAVHPMAKLVAVANEFSNRVVSNPHFDKMNPHNAISQMIATNAERFDPVFLQALLNLFGFTLPEDKNKTRYS